MVYNDCNFITIYMKRNKAQKAFNNGDFANAKMIYSNCNLFYTCKYNLRINCYILGITLRGF